MPFVWVFLGGGLGSLCRYGISRVLAPWQSIFPYATLAANALSCIVLGAFVAFTLKSQLNESLKLFAMVGFCGGFSTYSTFTNETWQLLEAGNLSLAALNILGNLFVCLACIGLGLWLGRSFL